MNRKKRTILHKIYAKIPDAGCKGLCTNQCTIIGMAKGEWDDIVKRTGIRPHLTDSGDCSFLKDGKCSIYQFRPLVCRLFGSVDNDALRCEHGCLPDKPLTIEQSDALVNEVEKFCGDGKGRYSDLPPKIL